jgi:RHS repeat-associated protein
MLVPRRHGSLESYKYGFQGQEKDDEIKGEGNSLNYTFRMHDPRVGRFFAVDPLFRQYAYNSPYAFSENRVMQFNELEGLEIGELYFYAKTGVFGKTAQTAVVIAEDITEEVIRSTASSGLIVGSAIFVPIVNQANVVRTEGVHAGGAYKKSNYVFEPGVYKLDSNWNIINMGNNNESNKEVAIATVETLAATIPVERLVAPIISRLASKVPARRALMKIWERTGFASKYADDAKPVFTQTLKEGDVLYQYRIPGTTEGSYYVKSLDVKPEHVGISSSDYTEIYKVTVRSDNKVLISTHKENIGYWRDEAKVLEGGGEQIFSRNLKENATFEPIN